MFLSSIEIEELAKVVAQFVLGEIQGSGQKEELLTCKQTEEFLKVSNVTRIKYTNQGILKAYKLGSRTYYKKSELLQALQQVEHLF